jgi:putative nucleotidyltransferase with HDIG domain
MAKLLSPQSKDILRSLLKEGAIQQYLNSLKEHHPETYHHSVRVGLLCLDIGLELDLEQPELTLLGYAGLLHDIGKRKIPEAILSKTSPLSPAEREIMKEHPRLGFLELDQAGFEVVGAAVVSHHEFKVAPYPRQGADRRRGRRDGGGRRGESELAPFLGEIVAVADMYDALSNRRAYKPAMPKDKVEEVLREQFTGRESLIESVMQRHDD